jgi:hypothetical protein
MGTERAAKLVETQQEVEMNTLREATVMALAELETTQFHLEEKLSGLSLIAESVGWTDITSLTKDDGPSLDQLKRRSKQIRSAIALNAHLHQALALRTDRVFADPCTYSGVPGLNETPVGRGVINVGDRFNSTINQYYVFGPQARVEREAALFSDGMYFVVGDDSTRELSTLPLSEISGDFRNPERSWEVWAYRHSWWDYSQGELNPTEQAEWIFTDVFKSKAQGRATIKYAGKDEPVNHGKTIIDGKVNSQVGWAYGFPDAGGVIEWARLYSEFMKSGKAMSDAMARIWAQVKNESSKGASNAAAKMADMSGFGNVNAGVNADLAPLATAGRSYDFEKGLHLLSVVAAGLGVSVVALSSNPGAAGGSYGAAQVLTLPERLSTQMRRTWHAEFEKRVLRYLGAKSPDVKWPPLVDGSELLRLSQAAQTTWNSGLYKPEEAKAKFEQAWGNFNTPQPVPDGVLIPNNEKSLPRKDIDTDGAGAKNGTGQGQGTGIGDNPGVQNDMRDDLVN